MILEYELGPGGLSYMRNRLSLGNEIARQVATLPLHLGRAFALLPEGIEASALAKLEEAGAGKGHVEEITNTVAEHLHEELSKSPTRLLVLEHALARSSDPCVLRDPGPMFTFQSEVFFFLESRASSPEAVLSLMRRALTAYGLIGTLTELSGAPTIQNRQEVASETIHDLTANTLEILVQVFDGEAYVIWQRAAPRPS